MRALSCLDPRTPFDVIAAVTSAAGLDAVVVDVAVAADEQLCDQLRDSPLAVVVNVPLLHAPGILAEHPELYAVTSTGGVAAADWLHMACPTSDEFWQLRTAQVGDQLARLRPDVVCLDFARNFVRWELVPPGRPAERIEHGCWCERCLDGLPQPPSPRDLADRRTAAVTARVRAAAQLVRTLHPEVTVAVKTVPWLDDDHDGARTWVCGQDLVALAEVVDAIMPMSYSAMIGRPASHVGDVRRQISRTTGLPVIPWLQAAHADGPDQLDLDVFDQMLTAVDEDATHGYCVFHLDGIADRPELLALLKARSSTSDKKENQ